MQIVPTKKSFFDLNAKLYISHILEQFQRGVTNVFRQNGVCSSHGISADVRIPKMCQSISRRLQSKKFLKPRSILMHGVCAINLPRKFTRYPNVSSINAKQ